MSRYQKFTTITGREIFVRENKTARSFTIKTESGKYRTMPMSRDEFNEAQHNTGNDWANFLKGSDYFPVK